MHAFVSLKGVAGETMTCGHCHAGAGRVAPSGGTRRIPSRALSNLGRAVGERALPVFCARAGHLFP